MTQGVDELGVVASSCHMQRSGTTLHDRGGCGYDVIINYEGQWLTWFWE